jgi:hypothetical protein
MTPLIPLSSLQPLPELEPLKMPELPEAPRNWLLKFDSQRQQYEWLTVYCAEGEICAIAEKIEARLNWTFRYDWTEL